jgi:hypothetical protein
LRIVLYRHRDGSRNFRRKYLLNLFAALTNPTAWFMGKRVNKTAAGRLFLSPKALPVMAFFSQALPSCPADRRIPARIGLYRRTAYRALVGEDGMKTVGGSRGWFAAICEICLHQLDSGTVLANAATAFPPIHIMMSNFDTRAKIDAIEKPRTHNYLSPVFVRESMYDHRFLQLKLCLREKKSSRSIRSIAVDLVERETVERCT